MEQKPFLIGAIIGNSSLLGGISENGQLERLFWPRIDTPQNIGRNWLGLRLDKQKKTLWLRDPIWQSKQCYEGDTNLLCTELTHVAEKLTVELLDFAAAGDDLLVRRIRLTNRGLQPRMAQLLLYSDMLIGEYRRYHTTVFQPELAALWQFKKNSHFLIAADRPVSGYQCGRALRQAEDGELGGELHAMASDGAVCWQLGRIEPGQCVEINVYMTMGETMSGAVETLADARSKGGAALAEECREYWQTYLEQDGRVSTGEPRLEALYRRSLLVFHLMTDKEHGSMLAAPEFDEDFTNCGGYSYCWGRDAAYITYAIDRAGMKDAARRFYRWTIKAQNENGAWEQRHYLDGSLAPNWGLQIDETGSIIWGMWQHYQLHKEMDALLEFWPSMQAAAEFLLTFRNPTSGLPAASMDLWEERLGEHTYSCVAVWAGLRAAADAAELLRQPELAERWAAVAAEIKTRVLEQLWSEERNCFLRGLYPEREATEREDAIVDVSLLGLAYPFGFLAADDPRMSATARAVEERLTAENVGGIKRYEDDRYIGGNPWILCTLWLALYHGTAGNQTKAKELLNWAVEHQTHSGLLPEQIDRDSGKPAWVIPLTWSHAMLVLAVLELFPQAVEQ